MCDINCIWLFNLLVAVVLIILQQQQHVVGSKHEQEHQHYQQQLQQHKYNSPYDGISSYGAAAAANYLRHSTMPHNIVKREIKKEKTTDFISYLNDFNMQDETSIPEDIIDQQHLQEIIDKQQQVIQQQQQLQQKLQQKYVGDSAAGTSVLNRDGDIIDVNLPYDDSTDTDSDADIILESQRSSERSDDNKTSNSSSKNDSEENEMVSEEKLEIDKNRKNLKKTSNKKDVLKERKTLNNNNDNTNKDKKKQQIKFKHNIDYSSQYKKYGNVGQKALKDNNDDKDNDEDEDEFELDEDDDDDGSAEYERFKSMREQRQKEQQQKEQMSTQKTIINDGTFNNQYSDEKMVNNRDNDKIKHMVDYTDDNNKNKNINDYEIFHKHLMEQRQKLLEQHQQQQQNQQQTQFKQDAIGDIEDNEQPDIFKASASNTNMYNNNNDNENKNNFANIFIPRKMKRHNGAARLDDATNRYTRLKQEQQLQQQQQQLQLQEQLKSQINTDGSHPDAVAKVSSQEENFKKKYYDILKENSTTDQHPQHHHHLSSGESNPKDLSFYDDNNEKESTHEAKKQTSFEKEKSLRRNNKRYGHKSHKKKYKDYLRYAQIMMMTSTTTPSSTSLQEQHPAKTAIILAQDKHDHLGLSEDDVADLDVLKDKHIKKLELEKIKSLVPPAPIFVLKAREEEENKEKELAKLEEPTTKPFYEGQINYFLETPDDDSERANEVRFITKGERMDTNDWYKKLSPVLRNGNKKMAPAAEERSAGVGRSRGGYTPYHHYRPQHHGQQHHGQTRNHYYHQQHHHQQQQQHRPGHHHQVLKHSRHHAYQRKLIPKRLATTTTPMPPPSRKQLVSGNGLGEMGHQITDIKDLERYYAKWPHLARVQSQLHEEQMREQQSENYPDYEYDSDDYLENENDNKDDNLPPYIRKFNRRNKQLLDLLEGTIAPPTKSPQQLRWSGSKLQPGPRDSSVGSMSVHIDDDYLKEKRKRYHQRQRQIHDLFSQQRTSTTTTPPPPYPYVNSNTDEDEMTARQYTHTENHLPDEDVSISLESNEQENEFNGISKGVGSSSNGNNDDGDVNNDSKSEQEIWQKEIETKSANVAAGNLQIANWQMEKLITSAPPASANGTGAAAITKKSAIHKLPSYPSIAGGYMNRPRSRSAQFAPSSGSDYRRVPMPYLNNLNNNNDNINKNNNNFINAGGFVAYNKAPVASKTINGRFSANIPNDYNTKQQQSVSNTTTTSEDAANTQSSSSSNNHLNPPSSPASATSSSSVTNSFIYHRVVDASPRLVGAGFIPGRKQRLPFVAITDRRLETSKKSLTDHQKDFEQNHYPLP